MNKNTPGRAGGTRQAMLRLDAEQCVRAMHGAANACPNR